jgi:hypothetical protein
MTIEEITPITGSIIASANAGVPEVGCIIDTSGIKLYPSP